MGFDSNIVHILFGIQVPNEDKERVFMLLNCQHTRPKQKWFNIPNTNYYFIDYINYSYVYVISLPFGLGENDGYCGATKIIPPTNEQIEEFNLFLTNLDINYCYAQWFLP